MYVTSCLVGSHRDFMIYMPTTRGICLGNCIPHTSLSSYQNLPSALICDVCACVCPLLVCQLCTRNRLHNSVLYPAITYVQYSKVTAQVLSGHFISIFPGMMGRGSSKLTRCLKYSFCLLVCCCINILHWTHMNSKLHYQVLQE